MKTIPQQEQRPTRAAFAQHFTPGEFHTILSLFRAGTFYETTPEDLCRHVQLAATRMWCEPTFNDDEALLVSRRAAIAIGRYPSQARDFAAAILAEKRPQA